MGSILDNTAPYDQMLPRQSKPKSGIKNNKWVGWGSKARATHKTPMLQDSK